MKKTVVLFTAFVAVIFILIESCQENDSETKITSSIGVKIPDKNVKSSSARVATKFTTDVGKPIPAETAMRWIENYFKKNPDGIRAHYFGRDTFSRLFEQEGSVGISLKYAINDFGESQILLVAIDENGKELVAPGAEGYDDASKPCPPNCSE